MAESRIKDENFYQVSGWMLNRLGLKGTALDVYAIIYGFTQDGESWFSGSLQYLMDFTNASRRTVINTLKDLTERGYLKKRESLVNGVKYNAYQAARNPGAGSAEIAPGVVQKLHGGGAKTARGVVQKLHGGSAKTAPNNNKYNISDNKEDKERGYTADKPPASPLSVPYESIRNLYNETCVSLSQCKAMSEARKKAVKARFSSGYSLEDFKTLFEKAEASSFLKGKNGRNWRASFDWLIKDANMAKVLDGNYDDKGGAMSGADPKYFSGQQYGTML